jgi:hypothetical protein
MVAHGATFAPLRGSTVRLPALYARNFPCPRLFKIASAMIERAELPVQRNSALNGLSAMTTPRSKPKLCQ